MSALLLDGARGHDLSTSHPSGFVTARGSLTSGGRLRVRGTVDPERQSVNARLKLDGAAMAPLGALVSGGVRVKEGWMSAAIDMTGPPFTVGRSALSIHRLNAVAPREGGEDPVLAWERLDAAIEQIDLAGPSVRLRRLTASWPYL